MKVISEYCVITAESSRGAFLALSDSLNQFSFPPHKKTIQTDRLRMLFINSRKRKSLRRWLFMRKSRKRRSDDASPWANKVVKIIIHFSGGFALTKVKWSQVEAPTQSTDGIFTDTKEEANPFMMRIMHAWFHHVVQCMKSIKLNDAEPSREGEQQAYGDIKAQNNSSCSSFSQSEKHFSENRNSAMFSAANERSWMNGFRLREATVTKRKQWQILCVIN